MKKLKDTRKMAEKSGKWGRGWDITALCFAVPRCAAKMSPFFLDRLNILPLSP